MIDFKSVVINKLFERTILIDDGPDGRGGWYTHYEPDPLCVEAANLLKTLGKPKTLVWVNSGGCPEEFKNSADAGPLGLYYVSDGYMTVWHNGNKIGSVYSLSQGKAFAQTHFEGLVKQLLD